MSRGVVTLTAAGAIDATYRVDTLSPGGFVRASDYEREVSGKGVNVAAALHLAQVPVAAVVVLGADDDVFVARSAHAGLLRTVTVPGATRVNTSIIDATGATTKVNAPAPPLDAQTWRRVQESVRRGWRDLDAEWLVISGTLPASATGSPVELVDLIAQARAHGVRVALDTSGAALARAVARPDGITVMKPNTHELAEAVGRPLATVGDVRDAARELIARGVESVYASMGADGVLAVSASSVVHASATPSTLVNTAGAGDASLAGFLVGLSGRGPEDADALADAALTAARWGAHAVAQSTTVLSSLRGLPRARLTRDPDPAHALTEPAG